MSSYADRRLLRRLEGMWSRVEARLNRLTSSNFNPLYHLGTLSIFFLLVLTFTGIYLTIFYRPGAARAYETVAGISASWLGSLMRSTHRYAADGLIAVILLHALKMFLGDRFWGGRWLSWVSGWGLLVLVWVIGVMGYWLVWDQRAQWLTEYGIGLLKGLVAMPFLGPEIASRTFGFFVIILFLHIFLSILILLGVLVHGLRLSQARYWAPRWLMVETGVVLVLLALWRPASSAPPADLSRLVGTVTLDGWYLGFLPLAGRWGNPLFWGVAILVLGVLVASPWLARGRTLGPAVVTDELCTGCALCSQQCPYGAIEMRPRANGARLSSLAAVHSNLCAGCGLCVGTCSTAGIELAGLPTSVVRERLRQALAAARAGGLSPVMVFTCQRHATLGNWGAGEQRSKGVGELGAPAPLEPGGTVWRPAPATFQTGSETGRQKDFSLSSRHLVSLSQVAPLLLYTEWDGGNPHPGTPIVACALPCVGMVQPEWVRESLAGGAGSVVILSCPADDCAFREGPRWLAARLERYRSLFQSGVHWVEAAAGDQGALTALLRKVEKGIEEKGGKEKNGKTESLFPFPLSSFSPFLAGLAVLALMFTLALAVEPPATATPPDQGVIRVVLIHSGQLKATSASLPPEVMAKLPENVVPEQVLGGERFPVRLRTQIDSRPVMQRTYEPGGLRREAQVYGLESWFLPPGNHQVNLWIMDDGSTWRRVFSGPVEVEAGRVHTLRYDKGKATFILSAE